MTTFDKLDRPIEDDPTGMRALLAGLPDPGPMPEDLAARITAALDAEHRAGPVPLASSAPQRPLAPVVELTPRRPVVHRWLGAAAAAAIVVGGGGILLSSLRGGAGGSSTMAGAPEADSGAGSMAASDGPVTILLAGGTDITSGEAAKDLRASLPKSTQLDALASESPAIGPLGTALGARDCARALGVPDTSSLVVTLLLVDGKPGATILASTPQGERTAYAVLRSCPAQPGYWLSGPLPVP